MVIHLFICCVLELLHSSQLTYKLIEVKWRSECRGCSGGRGEFQQLGAAHCCQHQLPSPPDLAPCLQLPWFFLLLPPLGQVKPQGMPGSGRSGKRVVKGAGRQGVLGALHLLWEFQAAGENLDGLFSLGVIPTNPHPHTDLHISHLNTENIFQSCDYLTMCVRGKS